MSISIYTRSEFIKPAVHPLFVQGNKNVPFSLFFLLFCIRLTIWRDARLSFPTSPSLLLLFGLALHFAYPFAQAWPDQIGIICLAGRAEQKGRQQFEVTVKLDDCVDIKWKTLGGRGWDSSSKFIYTSLASSLCACVHVCVSAILTLFLTSINDLADSLWNFVQLPFSFFFALPTFRRCKLKAWQCLTVFSYVYMCVCVCMCTLWKWKRHGKIVSVSPARPAARLTPRADLVLSCTRTQWGRERVRKRERKIGITPTHTHTHIHGANITNIVRNLLNFYWISLCVAGAAFLAPSWLLSR